MESLSGKRRRKDERRGIGLDLRTRPGKRGCYFSRKSWIHVNRPLREDVNKEGYGFQTANLYHFIAFFNTYPDIFYAVSRKSGKADLNKIAELKLNLT